MKCCSLLVRCKTIRASRVAIFEGEVQRKNWGPCCPWHPTHPTFEHLEASEAFYSPPAPFSLSSERRTCACPATAPISLSRWRGVTLAASADTTALGADEVAMALHASRLGVVAARSACDIFPSVEGGAVVFESAALTAAALGATTSALRRAALSSTPRTREAKVREHTVSAASAASGDACTKKGSDVSMSG
jgi:hypothetical protein